MGLSCLGEMRVEKSTRLLTDSQMTGSAMKAIYHTPNSLKSNRILPGHGHGARRTENDVPGVSAVERRARRYGWTDFRAHRRRSYGIGGSFGLIGAILALMLMLFAATGPSESVFHRPADRPTSPVQVVDAAPAPTDVPVLNT